MGLGYRRQRAGIGLFEEIRLRNSVERSHPPDNVKDRRERDISYRSVNGISATATGKTDSPGPMKVPAEQLQSVLGITDVNYVQGQQALAVVDSNLLLAAVLTVPVVATGLIAWQLALGGLKLKGFC
jgi:hypothetical protein